MVLISAENLTVELAQQELARRAQEADPVRVVDRRGQDWQEPAQPDGADRDAWEAKPEQPVRRLTMPRPREMLDIWAQMCEALGFDQLEVAGVNLQLGYLYPKGGGLRGPDGQPIPIARAAQLVASFVPTKQEPDAKKVAEANRRMHAAGMGEMRMEGEQPGRVRVPTK
jgi:hypothetical protein